MAGTNGTRGAQTSPPPAGIYVPVPTFFAKEGTAAYDAASPPLDLQTQSEHSVFLAKGGVKGLVILGSSGEAVHVRNAERKELIKSQRKALDDAGFQDREIIAGTATQNIDDTIEMIKGDAEAGAKWSMVLTPGYFATATTQLGIQKWFEAVADKAAIPILIYHYPGVTNGVFVAPSTFEKLAAHPNIVGCKLSHGIMDDMTLITCSPRISHDNFVVFTGLGQNLLPSLTVGADGAIDGLAGIFPKIVTRLYKLYHDNSAKGTSKKDFEEMRELQFRICEGEKVIARWGVVGIKESLARVWSIGSTEGARLPLAGGFEDGAKEWAKWDGVFTDLKKLEESL
ncbi:aldolase [Polychaeton citri CBS 116435]|uniref:Aldolase n=1 Tax=Polychaeton citri CBS 116435 TaxID=1314669 RepID=A0A9P4ULG0_9PEZI|nr:aldolase [Polychaeton citri CBS 116435]